MSELGTRISELDKRMVTTKEWSQQKNGQNKRMVRTKEWSESGFSRGGDLDIPLILLLWPGGPKGARAAPRETTFWPFFCSDHSFVPLTNLRAKPWHNWFSQQIGVFCHMCYQTIFSSVAFMLHSVLFTIAQCLAAKIVWNMSWKLFNCLFLE